MKDRQSGADRYPDPSELDRDIGGGYQVLEKIGTGGMGAVYLAHQPGLERSVAIKLLSSGISASDAELDRFEVEARVLARCSHPNIVAIYDYGKTESGIPFLVMEYVSGGELTGRMQAGRLSLRELVSIMRQICDGLAYAHSRGLIHLDIKPSNLLMDDSGNIKIADFGLARWLDRGDDQEFQGATPLYAAPELRGQDFPVDHRADIYGVGVVLYEILTGKTPRGVKAQAGNSIRSGSDGMDSALERVTGLCLHQSPDQRYQSIAELEADLLEIFFSLPGQEQDSSGDRLDWSLTSRLACVFVGMFGSQIVGSAFNIWYNQKYIISSFFADSPERFGQAVFHYNLWAYIPLVGAWAFLVFSLQKMSRSSEAAKARVINLPWWALLIGGVGWLGAIPGLWMPLRDVGGDYLAELSVSISIGAAMALAQGFLVVDLLSQKLLYPYFFSSRDKPWETDRAITLSIPVRGIFWTISAGVCPVIALLLLVADQNRGFAFGVALVCLVFGVIGTWLMYRFIVEPLKKLGQATYQVGAGNLDVQMDFLRADEIGVLGNDFNNMVAGLRERAFIRERLGKSTGDQGQDAILAREIERNAQQKEIVAIAVKIADAHDAASLEWKAREAALDRFREVVERFGGLVCGNLGTVSLAVFGMSSVLPAEKKLRKAAQFVHDDVTDFLGSTARVWVNLDRGSAVVGTRGQGSRRELVVCGPVVDRVVDFSGQPEGLTVSL